VVGVGHGGRLMDFKRNARKTFYFP
jgi:hypothetical protein